MAKRGKLITVICPVCGQAFETPGWAIRLGRGRHCSRACSTQHMRSCRPPRSHDEGRHFWARIDKSAGDDGCWPWLGSCDADGYGQLRRGDRYLRAHRYALLLTAGDPPPERPYACHSCDRPSCCNPRHLRWASPQENMDDKMRRGRHRNGSSAPRTEHLSLHSKQRTAGGRCEARPGRVASGEGTGLWPLTTEGREPRPQSVQT